MKSYFLLALLSLICFHSLAQAVFSTPSFKLALDNKGRVVSLFDLGNQREYLYKDTAAAFLRVKTNGRWELPSSLRFDAATRVLAFTFPSDIRVEVVATTRESHLSFEITSAKPMAKIDRILWGSYPTTINRTVGEIIGVVRNESFAIGLLGLNLKTTGGFPFNDEGYDASRGSAALPRAWGSVLQAYSINRSLPRSITVRNGDFPNMPVVPLPLETIAGSKIALFGTSEKNALETIGKIELAEGLPHPMFNGTWIKQSPEMGRSYIISNFTEEEVDQMIVHVRRSGLMSLYHEGPFATWGSYSFNPRYFPNGKEGVKAAVKKVHDAGLHFGVHTLTNFINPTDPYVSPVPDDRLVKTGSSRLTAPVTASEKEIPVASPEYFNEEKNNVLHLVKIDKELIRYRAVSAQAPFKLMDCQRGAYNTRAASHTAGSEASKLLDHSYEVVFPSIAMQQEIATNLANLFNETGIDHLDFDGHEGGVASGQGDYGIEAFSKAFFDHADHFVVNGTSNSKHFYWHMNTYCNWGEPWYGGFRESMQEYRITNQSLFERNFMPNMMGWYLMTGTTSLSEMEWMLARAAGYNAGFAMVLRVRDAAKNPDRDVLLDAIREWETARRTGAFSAGQRERLKNPGNEFHLERTAEMEWQLYPYHVSPSFTHERKDLQPGEPTYSLWTFTNSDDSQPVQFSLEVQGNAGAIINPVLTIDQSAQIDLPVSLQPNERLVADGTPWVRIYDSKGKQRATINIASLPVLNKGNHALKFNATFGPEDEPPKVAVVFKTRGAGEAIKGK